MPTEITTKANEGSTFIVTAAFTDEDDAAVVPDSITWTLTDDVGDVVNSRSAVSVATPAASIDIVLSGADLTVSSERRRRFLAIEAVYDSDAGNNLPLVEELTFLIDDYSGIT